ncbi:hypothetical protein FJV41_42785 [Myxococcus llanfairpwllgwyngyllgogerychwyrndrobwllllantysiliogogogochensis]|uniref:Immunity MXAN-0049 protein domain-containing protein n=1 Tax=Myxococcus llanfairpwllgwyngyllgogerychwyrndrobwllllantysiliogogogochensis TaxID=2590453 RepID=A0A540WLB1_9BACT|nr:MULTISPECIES: DUF1629 domain-containing protein [Myxococcus]NTX13034.1 hypothetical protein [Myxococcus sp. CA056]NTX36515.1 hypothetical protein [Myxococcus sp. CA033]TQF09798.1 hypothetical protein FJV41_42785 [Myxococcus llanfairpwllgwyngyllgogerychwyrndrobwllllantysiliogogogochensis]
MKYFLLSTVGDLNDRDLCLIDDPPKGIGLRRFLMTKGRPAKAFYPAEAKIFLREENPGIKLSSVLGNTENYLIASSEVKTVFEQLCAGCDIEYLPFDLYDHRERLYSKDYFIINPIGALDCLDEQASGVTYGEEGSVIDIAEFVLDDKKVGQAAALFRIDKKPSKYVVDERFVQAVEARGFTNVLLTPLRLSGQG